MLVEEVIEEEEEEAATGDVEEADPRLIGPL